MTRFRPQALTERRRALGMRHEDIAVRVDRTASAIRMYESGAIDPPASIVAKLAEALDIDAGDLFEHEER